MHTRLIVGSLLNISFLVLLAGMCMGAKAPRLQTNQEDLDGIIKAAGEACDCALKNQPASFSLPESLNLLVLKRGLTFEQKMSRDWRNPHPGESWVHDADFEKRIAATWTPKSRTLLCILISEIQTGRFTAQGLPEDSPAVEITWEVRLIPSDGGKVLKTKITVPPPSQAPLLVVGEPIKGDDPFDRFIKWLRKK
jgi:hypothetical protein